MKSEADNQIKRKTYSLEIMFDEKLGPVTHEKTSEGIDLIEARLIVSILEEYKQRMMTYIMFSQMQSTQQPPVVKKAD